jgi:uncharacterized membrane protein required for colicin V production
VDIVALCVVALGTCIGVRRRLSGELAHLISVIVAFLFGLYAYQPIADWLLAFERLGPRSARAVAFVVAVMGAGIVMYSVRNILRRVLQVVIEEYADRVAGGVAGFVRASILVIIVFIVMNLAPNAFLNRHFGEESAIGRVVLRFMPTIEEELPKLEEKVPRIVEEYGPGATESEEPKRGRTPR